MSDLHRFLNLHDFERAAQRKLPRPLWAYLSGAVEDNAGARMNREAFARYGFLPRALVDVSKRTLDIELMGETFTAPFGIAPMGLSAMMAYEGDLTLARAAAKAGIPMVLSGASLTRMEDVLAAKPNAWFQAYLPAQDDAREKLVRRALRTGFKTLVVTVDVQIAANRENNMRAGFSMQMRPTPSLAWQGISHPSWLFGTFARTLINHGMPHFENNYEHRGAPVLSASVQQSYMDRGHLTWQHLARIREIWPHRLVVKGILHPQDAKQAVDIGAQGLIVSNHGGRQLDGAISGLQALPLVLSAVPREVEVMIDGGIRRGTDVAKALALGARCVFVGRPMLFAAAARGQPGVERAIELLRQEISRNVAMLGVSHCHDLSANEHLVAL